MKKIATLIAAMIGIYGMACLNISGRNIDGETTALDFFEFFKESNIPEKKSAEEIEENIADTKRWLKNAKTDERRDELHCDMGAWLIYQDKFQEAIDYMHEHVKIKDQNYSYYSNLGVAHELNGNLDSAYYWTQKGVETNPESHYGSEWIHIRILEAQLALEDNPDWLQNNNVLGYELGQDSIPLPIPEDMDEFELAEKIYFQLLERTYWVKAENKVVGNLLLALADNYSKYWDSEKSIGTYELVAEYDPELTEVVDKRLAYIRNLLETGAGVSNSFSDHNHEGKDDHFELSTEKKDGKSGFRTSDREWSTILLLSSITGFIILSAIMLIWYYRRKNG